MDIDYSMFTARKRSLGQGNVLHLSVILFGGGGFGFPACITGHMIWRVCIQGGLHFGRGWVYLPWDTTGYGQQAGGTHPTGVHSCSYMVLHGSGQEFDFTWTDQFCYQDWVDYLEIAVFAQDNDHIDLIHNRLDRYNEKQFVYYC